MDEEVSEEFAEQRAILVEDVQRLLLKSEETLFAEAMSEPILIDFFDMSVPEVAM